MPENYLIEFSKFLDASNEHLTYEAIALYINFPRNFNRKEIKFFEDHLNSCNECFNKFKELFDENIESNNAVKNIELKEENLSFSENDFRKFTLAEYNLEISFRKEKDLNTYLLFNKAGDELLFASLKISFNDIELPLRIVSLEAGKRYKIHEKNINISSINNIRINFLQTVKKEELAKPKRNKLLNWYAAASLAVIALLIYLLIPGKEPVHKTEKKQLIKADTTVKVIVPDTTSEHDKEIIIPVPPGFSANNSLENFVNRNIKSENAVKIISPAIGDTIKTHLHFKWSEIEDANEYLIEVVDNKNRFVWEKNIDYNEVTFLDKLEPGLYYWKIKYKGRMTAAGKFFVK